MNNKDFLQKIARQLEISATEARSLTETFIREFADHADDGTTYSIQGFGNFEVRKKMERIVANPGGGGRMLVPPKLVLSFKAGPTLKERLK